MDDLISRKAAIKAIEDLPNCYNGFSDTYDKSCIIGVLEDLPSAKPIMHDASDDADYISRETMKDLIDITTWYHQNHNKDMVEGASDEETAWFKAKDVFKAIENVPSAQQEITEKQVKEYCEKRCLIVLSSDAFHRLKSGRPERCEDCVNFNKARLLIPQSERKQGEWLDNETSYSDDVPQTCTCSVCRLRSRRPVGDFCKWCGADMRGEQDG